MKKAITLFLLLASIAMFGQDVSFNKSDIFKDKKKHSFLSFAIDDNEGGLVTIRGYYTGFIGKSLKGYYIEYFDSKLKLVKSLDYKVKDKAIRNAFIKEGQLHLIEYVTKRKGDEIAINVASAELGSLNFSNKELLSFSKDNVQKYFGVVIFPFMISNLNQLDGNHLGEVQFSANKKFFAINFDFKNKKKETHKVFVYNDNFEPVYDRLIVKDIKDRLFEYNDITIDGNDGTLYFLGKSYENGSKKTKKKGKTNYHFELVKVNAEGEKTLSLKDPDKFISSMALLNTSEKVTCIGFYGNKDEVRYNGVAAFNIDPNTLQIVSKKFNPFSDQFLADKYGAKENKKKRKKKKGLKNIDFRRLFMTENGDIEVNAEEFYVTTHTSTGANGQMRTYSVFHFDDIMAIRLDKDGNLKWSRNINKRQTGFSNSSFTSIPVGNTSYFFINCSDKIKKISNDRISFKQTKAKKSNLYVISLDGNGDFSYKKLIDDKDSKVYYRVNNGIANMNNNQVILTGRKKKNIQILKLKIN